MSRQERKAETRVAILESATRQLRDRGPVAPSVSEVMAGAGLTVGGFYAHFSSKDELMEEALRRSAHYARDFLHGGPEEKDLADLFRTYFSRAHRDNPDQGCPLPATVSSLNSEAQPGLRRATADAVKEMRDCIAEEMGGNQSDALALVALMCGGMTLARALGEENPLSTETLKSCRDFARAFLKSTEALA